MSGVDFPVKFTDRLRRLNRLAPSNKIQSAGSPGSPISCRRSPARSSRRSPTAVDLQTLVDDDEALAEHIRQNVAGMFHRRHLPDGRDPDDRDAVVDRGRVRGFEGLRVVDASIMPTVPRGNTNIPTTMLAEKIAAEMNAAA